MIIGLHSIVYLGAYYEYSALLAAKYKIVFYIYTVICVCVDFCVCLRYPRSAVSHAIPNTANIHNHTAVNAAAIMQ
jgi:hypothetical protein